MGFSRSWVDRGPKKDTAPRSVIPRSGHGGVKGFERTKGGADTGEAAGRKPRMIRFDHIVPDPGVVTHPRLHIGDTTRLAQSIMGSGLKQPLLVWMHEGEPYLVDGFRRFAALEDIRANNPQFANYHEEVEVEVVKGALPQVLIAQARANLKARSWTDADFASACAALVDAGLTKVAIAHKLEETVDRVFDAVEFTENAVEGLVEAVAAGYSYESARKLAMKHPDLQALAVEGFREGLPKKKKARTAKKKSVQSAPRRLKPKRRNNTQIGEDLDQVEEEIERLVNDDLVPFLTLKSLLRKVDSDLRYRIELTLQIAELRGIRHAKLHTLGRRPDLLLIEDPVHRFERGKRGQAFAIPSWRKE